MINLERRELGETCFTKMMPDQPFKRQTDLCRGIEKWKRLLWVVAMSWEKVERYEKGGVHGITRSQCLPGRRKPSETGCEGRNEQARRQNTWEASQVVGQTQSDLWQCRDFPPIGQSINELYLEPSHSFPSPTRKFSLYFD